MNNIYTLVYFQPSATGYDCSDGFIDSGCEIEVITSLSLEFLSEKMAELNSRVYDRGTLNRPSYQYINTPLYEFTILVNGESSDDIGRIFPYEKEDYIYESYNKKLYELNLEAELRHDEKIENLRKIKIKSENEFEYQQYIKLKEKFGE